MRTDWYHFMCYRQIQDERSRYMKRKGWMITLSAVGVTTALVLIFLAVGGTDTPQVTNGIVQVLETKSDLQESSYRVGADLAKTDFSSIGQILADKIAQEWDTYDSMTREQRMFSSKTFGVVGIQTDTWNECEEAIGFTVNNPLESLDWLNKTGYYGMESTDPSYPVSHVQAIAHAFQTADRKPNEINVTAGYNYGNVRITLKATFTANAGPFTTGSVSNGYATYKQDAVIAGSGIPVLIVTTDEANNTGYYNGDFFDPTAYWVRDNVFYSLRVFGEEAEKGKIQDILDRILAEL